MNDEHLYAQVTEELTKNGPVPGLWAKAFAESNGNEAQARAFYLRYRVKQLADTERQLNKKRKSEEAERRQAEAENNEERRKVLAKAEGKRITPIHIILAGIIILILISVIVRYFNG